MADQRKQYLLALMFVSGLSYKDMADRTGLSEKAVRSMARSDLFKAQVVELQRQMKEVTLDNLLHRIEQEAGPSFETLMQLRNGNVTDPQVARIQLDATKFHLSELYMDRAHPKVTRQESENVLRVAFDREAIAQMIGALAEDRGEVIEVEAIEPRAVIAITHEPRIAVQDLDEVVAELDQAEAAE